MKKPLLLLSVLFLFGLSANAQFEIRPFLGMNFSNVSETPDGTETQAKIGTQFGANVKFGGRLFLYPGIAYFQRSTEYSSTASGGNEYSTEQKTGGVIIPILAGFSFADPSEDPFINVRLLAGPSVAFLTKSEFSDNVFNDRSLILQNFEKALLTDDLKVRASLMNFVIVGGGPTGVELAGALSELKNHVLPNDYPDLDLRRMQVHLLEGQNRLLPPMSEISGKKAQLFLEKMGVSVWLNTQVKDYDGRIITTSNKPMDTQTLIWAAGVHCIPPKGLPAAALSKGNRLKVNEFNAVEGFDSLFAIGDLASMPSSHYPTGHPQVAQPAIQQGKNLGKNLVRLRHSKILKPFKYRDLGSLATIGRSRAVADLPGYKTQGTLAWFIWMFVHLLALVGFRNKVVVFFNWTYNFFNYDRDIRLIIRPFRKP